MYWLPFTAGVCAVLVMLADRQWALAVHDNKAAWWAYEPFWRFINEIGNSTWWLWGSGTMLVAAYGFGRFAPSVSRPSWLRTPLLGWQLLAAIVLSGVLLNLFKIVFARARPRMLFREGFYGFDWWRVSSDYGSFPSGHTTTAFAVFGVLALTFPRWRWLFWLLAALSGTARIMLGSHYPADIVAGGFTGIVCALVVTTLGNKKPALITR